MLYQFLDHYGPIAVRKIQDRGLESAAHFVLNFAPTSFGDPLLPLLSSNYVSAYGRQEILDKL
jgi:hypothetical protein